MKTGNLFSMLVKLMLFIFLVLLILAIISQVGMLNHISYLSSFTVALVVFAVFLSLKKKLSNMISLKNKSEYTLCLWLLVLCFIVNSLWIVFFKIEPSSDFAVYWNYALKLFEGNNTSDGYIALFPHIFGYSFFLSFFMKLIGTNGIHVPVINVILSCISGVLIFLICRKCFGKIQAVFGYLLWVFLPSKLIYNSMVLSEPMYTCLTLLFFLLVVICEEKNKTICCILGVLSGLVLAWINSLRPLALILIIALFIRIIFLTDYRQSTIEDFKKRLLFTVFLIISYIPACSAWNNYTESILGEEIASFPGYNIYVGFNRETKGSHSQADMDVLLNYYYNEGLTVPEAQTRMLLHTKERISDGEKYNFNFFREKLRKFLGNDEGGAYYALNELSPRQYSFLCVISNCYYYFLVFLTIMGCHVIWKNYCFIPVLIAPLFAIGLTLAHLIVEVAGRYHYSILPVLIIVASASFPVEKNNYNSL